MTMTISMGTCTIVAFLGRYRDNTGDDNDDDDVGDVTADNICGDVVHVLDDAVVCGGGASIGRNTDNNTGFSISEDGCR